MLPSSVGGVVANLAITLNGKIPVNLNFTAGQKHVDSAIRRCGITQIIGARRVVDRVGIQPSAELIDLEAVPASVSILDKVWAGLISRAVPTSWLGAVLPGCRGNRLQEAAAVLFTSGTTGEPKGVVLSHSNILSNIRQIELQLEPSPDEVVLGVLPFFHAMGFTVNLWAVLCLGRKSVVHANPLEARIVGDLCRKHSVSLLFATPTFMRLYLKRCDRESFATVRRVALGAERLSGEQAVEIRQTLGIEPLEGYGCTELSPVVAFNVDREIRLDDRRVVSGNRIGTVGRPLPGTLIKTVHPETGADLPSGAEGIIRVKGPQVMVGYLDQPEATARVIHDGWYDTGDLGRVDEDGFLTISGRLARFSKLGGEMVSHEQVEASVRDAAGVDDRSVVVTAIPDRRKGERLIVLYTELGGKSPDEIVRELIARDLPKLWIPTADDFLPIEAIPLLGNGKLDVAHLRELALDRLAARDTDSGRS
jgi:acyl-[acyl-carrier-protein]-phospholipid O-acyltransferase/long-chain-fatty-acid--[acyl-carrier-protein] ligase